jgi:hypothetical protein
VFIFIDESGTTDAKSKQRFLVVAFALMRNKAFADELIFKIKDKCNNKGKPIKKKEVRYHDLDSFQKEIAVQTINSKYRNFYICFIDLEKSHRSMITGKHENKIQTKMIHSILSSIEGLKNEDIRIIMDKKLSNEFQSSIKLELSKHFGSKKGIIVKTSNSSKERGIQVADIIAGAFRAKLMKKSDLFEVDLTRIFQISIPDNNVFRTEKPKEV